MKRTLCILVCAILAACDGNVGGSNAAYSKIKQTVGMSKQQVKELLGQPAGGSTNDGWTYYTTNPDSGAGTLCIIMFTGNNVSSVSNC